MNTILLSGTARLTPDDKVRYDIFIFGCRSGEDIQFVRPLEENLNGYSQLWDKAKQLASDYFNSDQFSDGAYTRFIDHIILI